MTLRVVNNKRLDMTEDEFSMYQKIVKSYTTATNKGEDLFIDLFETDDRGIIIFLRPPTTRRTTLEIFLFLMALFQHQHIRLAYQQVEDICQQMKSKMSEIDEKLLQLSNNK
jgi:hypothetical protein